MEPTQVDIQDTQAHSCSVMKHTENTRTTVIGVVDEDVVVRTTVHNLPTASFDSILVSQDGGIEVAHSHMFTGIVLHRATPFLQSAFSKTLTRKIGVNFSLEHHKKEL